YAEESRTGALLLGDIEAPALEIDDLAAPPAPGRDEDGEEARPAAAPDADPVGDAEILADLGISAGKLLSLCAQEGLLPSDVTAEICRGAGGAADGDVVG